MKHLFSLLILLITSISLHAMTVNYHVSFPKPHEHYVHVEMTFSTKDSTEIQVFMPVWTPGSYMVRDFPRHVDMFKVNDLKGNDVKFTKISKNTWTIFPDKLDSVKVSYRVYANELTVRTSHVDVDHAMLNGASIFMGVKGVAFQDHLVTIVPSPAWKVISTSLKPYQGNKWQRVAESYDILVDSPIEIGNHEVIPFQAGGIPHEFALIGESNIDKKQLIQDLTKIVNEEVALFKTVHPCESYLFIMHNTESTYGGLEHAHSSLNMVPRWNYAPRDKYLQTISLLSHEYFHLWNIKRIRPFGLGPFNYSGENYTRQLWLAEGVTSYYDDYFVYKAGVSSLEEYLNIVTDNLDIVINNPGDAYQSLGESSFDTWMKFYKPHENTWNNQVHYYKKGAAVMTALNLFIIHETKGEKSLDDVMQRLYHEYFGSLAKGFNEEKVLKFFQNATGLSLQSFFDAHIYGTKAIDYAAYFDLAGLELQNIAAKGKVNQGWILSQKEGKWIVTSVNAGFGAYDAGLSAEDEILAINGFRMNANWDKFFQGKQIGESVDVLISRAGKVRTLQMKITEDTRVKLQLVEVKRPSAQQLLVREKWLKIGQK